MDRIRIVKYGTGMNSPRPERRYLYLHITPFACDNTGCVENELRELAVTLSAYSSTWRREWNGGVPWWDDRACVYCRRRAEYEHKMWIEGRPYWHRRGLCMRHYLVQHLFDIGVGYDTKETGLYSNRLVALTVSLASVALRLDTANYIYSIFCDRMKCTLRAVYKGVYYVFTYRNHLNAYPRESGYDSIIRLMSNVMRNFAEFIINIVRHRDHNIIINGTIVLPPNVPNDCN
jgi:hypothetical protein